ncbi:MAG: hypothetical protein QXK12_04820 [Candidatus Nezhaarchaeales archaeon]
MDLHVQFQCPSRMLKSLSMLITFLRLYGLKLKALKRGVTRL